MPARDPGDDCGGWLLRERGVALLTVIPERGTASRRSGVLGSWQVGLRD